MRRFPWTAVQGFLAGCLIVGPLCLAPTLLDSRPTAYQDVQVDSEEVRLRAWEEWFRASFVPPVEVVIERAPLSEMTLGQTAIEGGPGAWTLRVTIREDLEGHLMVSVLLHELAHVMSFHAETGGWYGQPHGPEFGLWYSRIWTVMVEGGYAS